MLLLWMILDIWKSNSDVVSKSDNLITNGNELVGKEVTYGNTIQQNSLFYDGDITEPNYHRNMF